MVSGKKIVVNDISACSKHLLNCAKGTLSETVSKEKVAQKCEVLRKSESPPETAFERANDLLRYGISCLRGRAVRSKVKGRIAIALYLKRQLEEMDPPQWWQARILGFWIHRAQRGDFGE